MEEQDRTEMANMAAKAANLAIAGHENAKHQVADAEEVSGAVTVTTVEPVGFLKDSQGNSSSKRLQSMIGLGIAASVGIVGLVLRADPILVGSITGAFLTYSATLQGISASSERNMP